MAKTDYEWIAAGEEWSEPWGDCFSMIAPGESKRKAAARPLRNHDFMLEAQLIRRIAQHYPKAPAAS